MKQIHQGKDTEIVPFCPPPSPPPSPLSTWKSTAVSFFTTAVEIYRELDLKSEAVSQQPTYTPPPLDLYYTPAPLDRYYQPRQLPHTLPEAD